MLNELMSSRFGSGKFVLFLQSKHNAETEKVSGAEALSRYKTDSGDIITPDKYIDMLEDAALISELDFCMLKLSCDFLTKLRSECIIPISVNFSKTTFEQENFLDRFSDTVKSFNIPPSCIELEITELHRFHDLEKMSIVIDSLRAKGYSVSIDDYGKNSSAFSIIRHVDIDIIKMDKEIIWESTKKEKTKLIFKSVVDLSKKLNISVIAEGVETAEQLALAKEMGCDNIQGWYFSKAIPDEEFMAKIS